MFKHNSFDIIEEGDFVLCAVSGKEIELKDLNYWNVDLQEAYFSVIEANQRYKSIKKISDFISIYYVSKSIGKDFSQSFFQALY